MKALFNITVLLLYLKLQLLNIIKYPFFVPILNCFINVRVCVCVCVCVTGREREREREKMNQDPNKVHALHLVYVSLRCLILF